MPAESKTIPERELLLDEVVTTYLREVTAGQTPDRKELLARHPGLAAELAEFFADQDDVQRWAAPLRMVAAIQAEGTLGDFRIIREIGRGGMGVVYEAVQISLGRRVALKVLPFAAALDSKQLQRFKNEAQAAAGLQHTNIVPVYFVGCERGVHFYAMQYVEGQTLAALIQELRQIEGRNGDAPSEPRPLGSGSAKPVRNAGSNPLQRVGDRPAEAGHYEPQREAPQGTPPYPPRPPEDLASELTSGRWAGAMLSPGHPSADLSSSDAEARRKHATPSAADSPATGPYVPSAPVDQTPQAANVTPPVGALSTQHSTSGPAFFRTVANLGIQAAEALEHAHQLGVIHRDIKPANLMVDARGNLWITDFGLAHCQGAVELTMSGDLLGTLRYMSPEQALAQRVLVDQRTDIYSLGVTLYELLTLEPAFPSTDRQELLRQIAFEEPRPARRLNKAIPVELETIILKAMEKNPTDRYASAQEVADDLRRFLEDKPILAKRAGVLKKMRKWGKRHPAVIWSGMILLLMALVGSSVTLMIGDQKRRETADALANVEAVLDFVENKIFAAARPEGQEGGLGRDVSLRQAVEAALPYLDTSFKDRPLTEARLRNTLGLSFLYLGDAKTAEEQCEKARAIYTEHLGPEHPYTLASMNNLANSYADLGRHADALKLREETLALMKTKLGPDHPDTLNSMHNLAGSYDDAGRTQEVLKLHEETLQRQKAKLSSGNPDILRGMHYLANSYYNAGRNQEALKLFEETLQLRKAKLGPDHPDTLASMNNLAESYAAAGRTQEALKLREETLRLKKAKLGPDHPDTLGSTVNLANSYYDLGRHADAVKLLEGALPVMRAKMPYHQFTFNCMNNLAAFYAEAGRVQEALKLREETFQLQKAKLGPDHPQTLSSMRGLLDMRVRLLVKEQKVSSAVETAAKIKQLAGDKAEQLYDAACAYALCAGEPGRVSAGSPPRGAEATTLGKKCAEEAMALLKQAVARGYKNAAHMKQDKDLDALRDRADFQKLLAELEAAKKD